MEKIASFTVDHIRLKPGVFVSRMDSFGETVITTFDLRFKRPNKEPVIDMPALHTIEHLAATFLRSDPVWGKKIVYFGPMGCRTGFYLILEGMLKPEDIVPVLIEMLEYIQSFQGKIPGASESECGNFREHNIDMARYEASKYEAVLKNASKENLNYPPPPVI